MIFKGLSNNKLLVIIRLYLSYVLHYSYILFFTNYYSKNKGKSYRLDVKRLSPKISINCYYKNKCQKPKLIGNKQRYFLRKGLKYELCINIEDNSESFDLKYIIKYPFNHIVLILIFIIIPICFVILLKNFFPVQLSAIFTKYFKFKG